MIIKQSKVIMRSICLFASYCTSTTPAVSLCIEYVWIKNANFRHTSTEDILLKAASTSPEMWHRGWCVENESNHGSILMGNISPQWGEKNKPFYAPAILHPQCKAMGEKVEPGCGSLSVCKQKRASWQIIESHFLYYEFFTFHFSTWMHYLSIKQPHHIGKQREPRRSRTPSLRTKFSFSY